MAFFMGSSDDLLMGLIKELKGCHKRIAEHEAHIARERQTIAATIEAHQARLAKKRVQQEAEILVHHHQRERAVPSPEIDHVVHGLNA